MATSIIHLSGFRILMVWLYDRTKSLLITTLMHSSLIASTIFIFRPIATGYSFFAYGWLFSAAIWAVVAIVAVADRITSR